MALTHLAQLWWRAYLIVTCTAFNVVNISNHAWELAFISGGLLSFVWWGNAKRAAASGHWADAHAYALGAACGTVTGMLLGDLLG